MRSFEIDMINRINVKRSCQHFYLTFARLMQLHLSDNVSLLNSIWQFCGSLLGSGEAKCRLSASFYHDVKYLLCYSENALHTSAKCSRVAVEICTKFRSCNTLDESNQIHEIITDKCRYRRVYDCQCHFKHSLESDISNKSGCISERF